MTPQDYRATIDRWFNEVWNQGREETIHELLSPDCMAHGIGEAPAQGPHAFCDFVRSLRNAFPDIRVTVEDTLIEGDKAAIRVELTGTHKGEGLGMPPTGKPVKVEGIIIAKFQNGQMVEGWNSWDQLGLYRQLGIAG